jgi:quercetin dioxygenase-like cupin family protein
MHRLKAAALAVLIAAGAAGLARSQPAALPVPTVRPVGMALGSIDLGKEFPQMPGMQGRTLNLSLTTVAPGAGMAAHSHKDLPEIAHIISGVLTEQRNGAPPTNLGPGSTLINDSSTTHAYVNLGKEPVVFYIANIRPPAAPAPAPALKRNTLP